MANDDQREAWNGLSGDEWVRLQEQFDSMLEPWIEVLDEAAGFAEGQHVLDIGCGCGATTRHAAQRCAPSGTALGFDLSEQMVAQARMRAGAEDVTNVRFATGDAQVDDLSGPAGPYDVAISRFGVMFFDDPVAAFANVARSVRPGGRLAILSWAPMAQQEWITVPAAVALQHVPFPDLGGDGPGMFSLSEPDRIADVLQGAGWQEISVEPQARRVLIGGGGTIDQAMDFLVATGPGRALLGEAEPDAAKRAVEAIAQAFEQHTTPSGVELGAVALSVTARLPG